METRRRVTGDAAEEMNGSNSEIVRHESGLPLGSWKTTEGY